MESPGEAGAFPIFSQLNTRRSPLCLESNYQRLQPRCIRRQLLSCCRDLLGELPYFVSDGREAATMLTSSRRLDGGVESEQIRLIRYGLDRAREANHFGKCELEAVDLTLRSVDDQLRAIEDLERLKDAGPRP